MSPEQSFSIFIAILAATAIPSASGAFAGNPLTRVKNDFLALTRKTTTRHILLPKSSEAALKLKQKIRTRVSDDGEFVVDAFSAAAERYSLDAETAKRGGLLGTLAPQGFCICPELDEVCFRAPLGEVYGPVESDFGYHLVLVCERTNCPKLDGGNTRIVRGEDGETLLAPPEGGYRSMSEEVAEVGLQQIGFWMATFLAAGVVSEIAAKAAGVVETLPWEETIDLLE
mmetsp:Transcript_35026/g.76626  ORF Transcript_35026/g.76626 Transcript_35026/m.76626 type:complete len:228 (+) Transcript_35026:145-828(+)